MDEKRLLVVLNLWSVVLMGMLVVSFFWVIRTALE